MKTFVDVHGVFHEKKDLQKLQYRILQKITKRTRNHETGKYTTFTTNIIRIYGNKPIQLNLFEDHK